MNNLNNTKSFCHANRMRSPPGRAGDDAQPDPRRGHRGTVRAAGGGRDPARDGCRRADVDSFGAVGVVEGEPPV